MRVAAIDCGTNSLRLLIADVEGGVVTDVTRTMEVVRLGAGVDETGRLDPRAIERTRVALAMYVDLIGAAGVEAVRMVATSATRDAANRDEFFAMTADLLGRVAPGAVAEVISGEEEARLAFRGGIGGLDPAAGPFCVVDLGGGSTELILGEADGSVVAAYSADIGCVRMTERELHSDPPTAEETERARGLIAEALGAAAAAVPVERTGTLVGVAGTFTTAAAVYQGLDHYDPGRIHHSRIPLDELRDLDARIVAMTRDERAALGPMHPGRADVIGGGALVMDGIVDLFLGHTEVTEIVISESDSLDGIALELADRA